MFGQMTAGSWIYIGTQGILQGTYQTFAAAGEKHFGSSDLRGTHDPHRRSRRHGRRAAARGDDGGRRDPVRRGRSVADRTAPRDPLSRRGDRLARRRARTRARGGRGAAAAVGRAAGNAADVVPELAAPRGAIRPRHRPDRGARPAQRLRARTGFAWRRRQRCARPIRTSTSGAHARRSRAHVEALLEYVRRGSYVFDYGNNLRGEAREAGVAEAFSYPGFVPAYIRPLFCRGIGPFRWAALSGDPADIAAIDDGAAGAVPRRCAPAAVARARARAGRVPGAAGADLLARLRRPREGGARDQRARPQRARSRRRS